MDVPHMLPKCIFKDKELDVSRQNTERYDGERIECFVMSPKSPEDNAPCHPLLRATRFQNNGRQKKLRIYNGISYSIREITDKFQFVGMMIKSEG